MLKHAMPGVAAGGVERRRDTLVRALAHGLPGSLSDWCDIFNVLRDKAKDKAGQQLIQLFCKPRPKNSAIRRVPAKTHLGSGSDSLNTPGGIVIPCLKSTKSCPRGIIQAQNWRFSTIKSLLMTAAYSWTCNVQRQRLSLLRWS